MIDITKLTKPAFFNAKKKEIKDFIIKNLNIEDSFDIKVSKNVKAKELLEILNQIYYEIHKEIYQYTWPTYIFKPRGNKIKDRDYYMNITFELWDHGTFITYVFISDSSSSHNMNLIEIDRYNKLKVIS